MKHAEMLLKYQTYLLYKVMIKLESADTFKAIIYFLENIKGRISHKFFESVEAIFDKNCIDLYNKFAKLYLEKGFKVRNLGTEFGSFRPNKVIDNNYEKPVLEFAD